MSHFEPHEEVLRRALHVAVDTIEPAANGLDRIRERLTPPRPLAVAWLVAGWTDMAQPALLRVEPALAGLAGRVRTWLGLMLRPLGPASDRMWPAIRRLLATLGLVRPGAGMSRHEKLRSAMAFAAAAVIGAAGGFALSAGLPQQMISAASSFMSPSQPHHHSGGGSNQRVAGNGQHYGTAPGGGPHGKHTAAPSPSPACSRKAGPGASPSPSPSTSPSPGSSPSPSTSPSPSPSPSTSVSPSPSPSDTTPVSASPQGGQTTTAVYHLASPATKKPKPSPSCLPAS